MEIKNGILTHAFDTDCAYNKLIIPDRTVIIGSSSCKELDFKEIEVPDSVKKIEDFAFFKSGLEEITLPDGITYIGGRAFSSCHNLKKIVLPDSITEIGPSAFSDCINLEEVVLPANLTKINYRMFAECRRLKKITIPDSVTDIDWAVFSGCDSLEEISLPDSITTLNKQLFLNCKRLKRIKLPNSITSLPDEFFKNCYALDIVLDSKIDTLGASVFEGCKNLTTFPTQVKTFGKKCFKYCHKLTDVRLNNDTKELPNGMFDDCINLTNITYEGKNSIFVGPRCFRNCVSLKSIPSFIKNLSVGLFEGCLGLKEATIIGRYVPNACFRNCKNLKVIHNSDNISEMGSDAFSDCSSLEKIDLSGLVKIPSGALRNCKALKSVKLTLGLRDIGKEAFYNCINLEDFTLPDTVERIDKRALKHCESIKKIVIPGMLKRIHDDSFSHMYSLERIEVSPYNKKYITLDNISLICEQFQKFVLYAMGAKNKSYSLEDYCIGEYEGKELIRPITYIGPYAFSGARNLESLTLCTCVNDIERTSFEGCDNLKKLRIQNLSLFSTQGFKMKENGRHFFKEYSDEEVYIPFEEVEYSDDLVAIMQDGLPYFEKVKKIILPKSGSYNIFSEAFKSCKDLKEVDIPCNVTDIGTSAFPKGATLNFHNGLSLTGLVELISNYDYKRTYKLYELVDGTYYIEEADTLTKLKKQEIDEAITHSSEIRENPVLFLDFFNDLHQHDLGNKTFLNGILMANMSLDNRDIFFENIKSDDNEAIDIIDKSCLLEQKDDITKYLLSDKNFEQVIAIINALKEKHINNPELCHKYFMRYMPSSIFKRLLDLDLEYLIYIINESGILKCENKELVKDIFSNNKLELFIRLLKKYNIKSNIFINPTFISIADNPLFERMLSVYDGNIKRVILESCILDNLSTAKQNMLDLLTLLEITGALEKDKVLSQRASTFITEKMFYKKLANGKDNIYRIIGDDIHRIFNFRFIRDEFDLEFANFFLENYQSLVENERIKAGFIERVYINFREISKTCTSNKGSQRKLKVTIDKCVNYLSKVKFDGVNRSNQELADLIGAWYDNNDAWLNARKVYTESLTAPRNIFTEIKYDEAGSPVYDMDPKSDLREDINNDFSYEWLPKQAKENLVLGKYCNCCAHIDGAGQGIMRASMIHDSVQNLVIRDNLGEIIAKSTLYVNRLEGYAVFNNVESSINHRSDEDKRKIYKAFMRGAKAFIKEYNKNNEIKLKEITIGASRNTILEYLTDNKHPKVDIHQSLEFGEYSFGGYRYAGDWKTSQKLVLKR